MSLFCSVLSVDMEEVMSTIEMLMSTIVMSSYINDIMFDFDWGYVKW